MPSPVRILAAFCLTLVLAPLRGDDVLFIGNSFTFGALAPEVHKHGGVPKLFETIARAKGKTVEAHMLAAPGVNWSYHLAQPATDKTLAAKPWTWVVLQDYSSEPTHIGDIPKFMHAGETFSDRIAAAAPHAGIVLYETWARPAGIFYWKVSGHGFTDPAQMMGELHDSYAKLRDDLAARNPQRDVRVAPVGTAFARTTTEQPAINLNAGDAHHASAEGYYLAALVIYETIYHDTAKGAPAEFFDGALKFSPDDAAKLQAIADEVAGPAK